MTNIFHFWRYSCERKSIENFAKIIWTSRPVWRKALDISRRTFVSLCTAIQSYNYIHVCIYNWMCVCVIFDMVSIFFHFPHSHSFTRSCSRSSSAISPFVQLRLLMITQFLQNLSNLYVHIWYVNRIFVEHNSISKRILGVLFSLFLLTCHSTQSKSAKVSFAHIFTEYVELRIQHE